MNLVNIIAEDEICLWTVRIRYC